MFSVHCQGEGLQTTVCINKTENFSSTVPLQFVYCDGLTMREEGNNNNNRTFIVKKQELISCCCTMCSSTVVCSIKSDRTNHLLINFITAVSDEGRPWLVLLRLPYSRGPTSVQWMFPGFPHQLHRRGLLWLQIYLLSMQSKCYPESEELLVLISFQNTLTQAIF